MKAFEPQDPMELVGIALPQEDADRMAECLVEEYLFLGWNDRQLLALFTQPFFQATHRLYQERGEAYVRALIERVRDRWSEGWLRGERTNA